MWILVLIGIYTFVVLCGWIVNRVAVIREHKASTLAKREAELAEKNRDLKEEEVQLQYERFAVETLSKEKALGFPWLANAYSDFYKLIELEAATELETKKHPAKRAAERVKTIAAEKAGLRRENRILRELHRYYESLFPWLIDFKGEDLDALICQAYEPKSAQDTENEDARDPALEWVTVAESSSLSRAEMFQRALDRYWKRKKTPWQVGRDYERYVGYLHEREGFRVDYHGSVYGLEDLGRDLICIKSGDARIIQCKCWSSEKVIHEKHICQLVGTAIAYQKESSDGCLFGEAAVSAWLYTSAKLSETAERFAKMLNVQIVQAFPLDKYPLIKCNVSQRNGEKIYHLPFDQQYDRTLIEYGDECYVETVNEAEALGFRRAFRWKGDNL